MISGLDHIALAVNDLDGAVDAYGRMLGLAPNWIGGDGGARHAWFQLPNMALDIIAPHGEGAFGDTIRAHLAAHGEGLWALAFTTPDIEAAQALLARRGLPGTKPHPVRSTHDDGRKRYWTTVSLDRAATGGLNILLTAPPRDGAPWPLSEATSPGPVTRLDHVVVHTANPDRALAIYGAKLGLDLRLDRSNENWGVRQLFFHCADTVVEVGASLKRPVSDDPDGFGGLAWRVADIEAAHARLSSAGFDINGLKTGRKPGTKVFTVRSGVPGGPALIIQQGERP
ncbi:VOC family protein [Phenylobacterium koreense]|uniref:Catechol 2,3-dioxygenase-like lactoylglutathione lyase family enzyme n=3 Tax=Phenylobacterium TaxID=20 RepID=A0ABV2EIL8_9CAUL